MSIRREINKITDLLTVTAKDKHFIRILKEKSEKRIYTEISVLCRIFYTVYIKERWVIKTVC